MGTTPLGGSWAGFGSIETIMSFYAGQKRRLQESTEIMNYGWAEENMDVLTQSVAKALDHPKDMLILKLLNTEHGRRRLKASAEAFSLNITVLLTEMQQNSASPEELVKQVQQKLLGTSDSSDGSGGLKAAIISELQEVGKPEPVGLRTATLEQPSPPVYKDYKEDITYTLPASTTDSLTRAQPDEDSSSVGLILTVLAVVLVSFCIFAGIVTYWWMPKSGNAADTMSTTVNSRADEEAPGASDVLEVTI